LARLLEGRPLAEKIKEEIKQQISLLKIKPVLASLVCGQNAGVEYFIRSQKKVAQELGIEYQLYDLGHDCRGDSAAGLIEKLNNDDSVHGIILHMPLPGHIDCKKISQLILPEKDVEGLHPDNIGKILLGQKAILPCTAAAVMEMLACAGTDLYGKEAVVVGHSAIVGKPLALLLLEKFATVTVCHIGTSGAGKLEEHVRAAEVLIVAIGKPELIKGDWIKEGAVVIDVGINRVGERIVGDVEFEAAQKHASYITPVPGGVGPLTVVMLMRNLIEAVKIQQ
jgi:methylenetetrahydrofolate dehydrogenase (NADP+)/methenyltetrahydrofolate cyclohydrolase